MIECLFCLFKKGSLKGTLKVLYLWLALNGSLQCCQSGLHVAYNVPASI